MSLILSGNRLAGTIPECLSAFANLQLLQLFNNSLTGTLPPFGQLSKLTKLDVRYNQLTGTLDAMFDSTLALDQTSTTSSSSSALSIVRLDRNEFTGTIPTLPGAATVLTKVTLLGTNVTGTVPFCDATEYPAISVVEVDCPEVNCTCCSNCDVIWCFSGDC